MSAAQEELSSGPSTPSTTASVFTVAIRNSFTASVLRLKDGDESSWESRLRAEASSLGIDLSRPSSGESARSTSVNPIASGNMVTLDPEAGKTVENNANMDSSVLPLNSAASPTSSQDSVWSQPVAQPKSWNTVSPSTSPPEAARSHSFNSQPSFRPHPLLGFSRFSMRRPKSAKHHDRCHHCVIAGIEDNENVYTLTCGHVYCLWALKRLMQPSLSRRASHWPTCCGQPISRDLVELGGRGKESNRPLKQKSLPPLDTSHLEQPIQQARSALLPAPSEFRDAADNSDSVAKSNLLNALGLVDYKQMRSSHIRQRNRLLRWDAKHHAELVASFAPRREQAAQELAVRLQMLEAKYSDVLADVEDKHISAESNLRSAQKVERQNNLIALRHMEAFCNGTSATGLPHNRQVSEQDLRELEKARRLRDNMDIRHESAINVLRGEQNQRLTARAKAHKQRVAQNRLEYQAQLDRVQQDLDVVLDIWAKLVTQKKELMERCWQLESRIVLARSGQPVGLGADSPVTPISWKKMHASDEATDARSEREHDLGAVPASLIVQRSATVA